LKYAYRDTSGWHIETVDSGGWSASLAMDSSGYAHISHVGDGGLKYVYQDADGWHIEMIDNAGM